MVVKENNKRGKSIGREVEPSDLPIPLQLHRLDKWCRELQKRIEALERDSDPTKHNIPAAMATLDKLDEMV